MDMKQFLIPLLSIAASAIGYLIITFWVKPILHYREIKHRVAADLVFFANATELQKHDGTLREDTLQRKESNRRCASELKAIYSELPSWYRLLLKKRKENPIEASKNLIGLSNSSNWRDAEPFEKDARKNLCISDKNSET
ncbi:MAG: hypothetical protein HY272_12505 [Gammaproteobacteria bacterium]|nr:hypothetical protein [Gammaproteobacteria bacterium]